MEENERQEPQEAQGGEAVSEEPLANVKALLGTFSADWSALWKGLTLISLLLNVILLVGLFALGQRFFAFKQQVAMPLVESLERSLSTLEGARIKTQVVVDQDIPLSFELGINQETVVTLARPVRIEGANLNIQSVGFSLNAPAVVELPAGTQLPLTMEISVPVDVQVPLSLSVPVEIPLAQSDIYTSLQDLQRNVRPSAEAMQAAPDCWQMLLWGGACR